MPPGLASEAACIARPRACTTRSPSAKLSAPANARAVYSPRLRPAVPRSFDRRRVGRLQRFQRRQAGDINRRLADVGGVELFGRARRAEGEQIVAEDFGCLVEEFLRGRR